MWLIILKITPQHVSLQNMATSSEKAAGSLVGKAFALTFNLGSISNISVTIRPTSGVPLEAIVVILLKVE